MVLIFGKIDVILCSVKFTQRKLRQINRKKKRSTSQHRRHWRNNLKKSAPSLLFHDIIWSFGVGINHANRLVMAAICWNNWFLWKCKPINSNGWLFLRAFIDCLGKNKTTRLSIESNNCVFNCKYIKQCSLNPTVHRTKTQWITLTLTSLFLSHHVLTIHTKRFPFPLRICILVVITVIVVDIVAHIIMNRMHESRACTFHSNGHRNRVARDRRKFAFNVTLLIVLRTIDIRQRSFALRKESASHTCIHCSTAPHQTYTN